MLKYAVDDIYEVAKWFLNKKVMTHKKLQKLLYFSYGIYLAQNNVSSDKLEKALFENKFEAWAHGPVDPKIYSLYKNNGVNYMCIEKAEIFEFDFEVMNALNKTMEIFGEYSADELENISHNQAPWQNARKGMLLIEPSSEVLKDVDIYITFKNEVLNEQV